MIGISETQFSADFADNSQTFAASVANSLDGIDITAVVVDSVKEDTTSATAEANRRLTESVHVQYKVTYNDAALGYSNDPYGAYKHLLSELNSAIKSTDFNTYLANNAVTYSASDMASATSDSVESSYYTDASGNVPVAPNHKKRQTRYLEIGVIAGGGGFLILVWVVVGTMYYCSNHTEEGVANAGTASKKDGFEAVKTKEVELTSADGKV